MYKGRFDRRIKIERATESRDSFNNVIKTWGSLMTVWADKEDVRDSERIASMEVGAEITTRFRIEWYINLADLNPKDRIIYNDKIHNILAVKELGRKQGMEITATTRSDK